MRRSAFIERLELSLSDLTIAFAAKATDRPKVIVQVKRREVELDDDNLGVTQDESEPEKFWRVNRDLIQELHHEFRDVEDWWRATIADNSIRQMYAYLLFHDVYEIAKRYGSIKNTLAALDQIKLNQPPTIRDMPQRGQARLGTLPKHGCCPHPGDGAWNNMGKVWDKE